LQLLAPELCPASLAGMVKNGFIEVIPRYGLHVCSFVLWFAICPRTGPNVTSLFFSAFKPGSAPGPAQTTREKSLMPHTEQNTSAQATRGHTSILFPQVRHLYGRLQVIGLSPFKYNGGNNCAGYDQNCAPSTDPQHRAEGICYH